MDNPLGPVTLGRRFLPLIIIFPLVGIPGAVRVESALCEEITGFDKISPGTVLPLERRAISARTAPSHLISSSSVGAHNSRVRFVVTILNVRARCDRAGSPPGEPMGGDATDGETRLGCWRFDGKSYSRASKISPNENCR